MARRTKVIVSCAVKGSIHVPSSTPYLPITGDEIAESAIGAARAGAAIVHLHARDPDVGRPSPDPDLAAHFLPRIAAATNAAQVAKICRILGELSLEVAAPAEARQILSLKGAAKTAIPVP